MFVHSETAQLVPLSSHCSLQLCDGSEGCPEVLVLLCSQVLCQESSLHPLPAAQGSVVAGHLLLGAHPEMCLHLLKGHSGVGAPVGTEDGKVATARLLDVFVGVSQLPHPATAPTAVDTVHPQVLNLPVVELILEGAAREGLAAYRAGLLVPGLLQALAAEEVSTAGEHGAVEQFLADDADQVFANLAHKLVVHSLVGQHPGPRHPTPVEASHSLLVTPLGYFWRPSLNPSRCCCCSVTLGGSAVLPLRSTASPADAALYTQLCKVVC